MNDFLISIIVPIYKVEEYLPQCIESITRQTYSRLEIILVDDGSPDNCGKICDIYGNKDARIKIIHKKNGGLSSARNAGVLIAQGEWIMFVDADDVISKFTCERLLQIAKESAVDIVIGDVTKFYYDREIKNSDRLETKKEIRYLSREEAIQQYFYRKFAGYACGKLYRTDIVKNINFPNGKLFEDAFTVYKYIEKAKGVAVIPDELYYYRQRKGGIIHSSYDTRQLDIIFANQEARLYFKKEKNSIKDAVVSRSFVSAVDVLRKIPLKKRYSLDRKVAIEEIEKLRKKVIKDDNNSFLVRGMALFAIISPQCLGIFARMKVFLKIRRV